VRKLKVVPMQISTAVMDRSHMLYFTEMGQPQINPQMAWYIDGAEKHVLVDTAFPAEVGRGFGFNMGHMKSMEDHLKEEVNLTPDDIDIVLYTHLHLDHCSSSSLFKNARHIVQEKELKAAFDPHPMYYRFFYRPELIKDVKFETIKGDKEIVEGVSVMLTPGHTPGGQSIVIYTEKGRTVITSMCAIAENFEPAERWPEGFVMPGIYTDPIALYDSMKRIKEVADIILPNHMSEEEAKKRLS
jgi:N-acyl homoserine lactone hydrolase